MTAPCARLSPARAALALVAALGSACASAPAAGPAGLTRELVLAFDDGRATGTLAFPSMTYESVLRFAVPAGEHQPLRLRLQAGSEGRLEVTIYDTTILETPGEVLRTVPIDLAKADVSDGKDGRWVVADLASMKPIKGVVWIGVRKGGGEPTLWASSVASGQAFVRNNDPSNFMGLLPTKRTPMVRLELVP
jgi:hypothetical protein